MVIKLSETISRNRMRIMSKRYVCLFRFSANFGQCEQINTNIIIFLDPIFHLIYFLPRTIHRLFWVRNGTLIVSC